MENETSLVAKSFAANILVTTCLVARSLRQDPCGKILVATFLVAASLRQNPCGKYLYSNLSCGKILVTDILVWQNPCGNFSCGDILATKSLQQHP